MIIETSDNQFYRVRETNQPGLDHVWYGEPVKKVRGQWETKARRKTAGGRTVAFSRSFPILVRKAATRVVEA